MLGSHSGFFSCKIFSAIITTRIIASGPRTANKTVIPATDKPEINTNTEFNFKILFETPSFYTSD